MPSRNVIKLDSAESFYHVYARGGSRQQIFCDPSDYAFFTHLFARYLSKEPVSSHLGGPYPHFRDRLELLAYCQMPNHFHLLVYQNEPGAMAAFMRSLLTSYSRYFNAKYGRSGAVFESRYKASLIQTTGYLDHISRYIHLNPRYYKRYPYSSYRAYERSGRESEWLQPGRVLAMFRSRSEYADFVADYGSQKAILDELKHELADS